MIAAVQLPADLRTRSRYANDGTTAQRLKIAFESGWIFVDIKGLDMAVVGVAVPNRSTGKRILVPFLREHFDQNAVDVLAREGLVDYKQGTRVIQIGTGTNA